MAITQLTRFKSDKPEEMIKTAKQAKTIRVLVAICYSGKANGAAPFSSCDAKR
jgi:hypothetical protein